MISEKFRRFLSESKESRMSLREAKRICENAGYKVRFNESKYTVQPQSKEELQEIIEETIREKGPRCDLNFIDTSKITVMSRLFAESDFNGDISKWDTSNVENMGFMFADSEFNGDISKWNVSKVWDMTGMFAGAESFNQPIGNWNVSRVEFMDGVFAEASSFNQPIGNWDVSNVKYMGNMFDGAKSFKQSLDKWDVSNVKEMDSIFNDCPLEDNPPSWYNEFSEYLNEARKAQKLSKGDYVGGCLESLYTVWRGIIVEDNVYYWYVWTGDEAEQGLQASINAYKHNPKQAKRIEKYWLGKGPKFKIVCGGNDVYKFGSLEKANEWVDKIVERGYL